MDGAEGDDAEGSRAPAQEATSSKTKAAAASNLACCWLVDSRMDPDKAYDLAFRLKPSRRM
jgi:hypothetical protein